ncbi:Arylsulfatase [Fusarium oxysporum f. sp. raphani]|uniref:Arylsulfatase n=1 Tax=Fusarium oxysporum f. sp. raphani TaxID=96318 RepID=A0A8J5QFG1_FUSOX|nr:Arylsulfatase [Fusarium oxysporum f. sp. raphani]
MRGQAAHNTNNTNISVPGGGYPKFVVSGENEDYLPHWLAEAGYKAEYIGKLFNGNSLLNYSPAPAGWSHIDVLLEPYINNVNTVVMSENGARPKWYRNWQQTDVLRIKAAQKDPFFLMIAPTAPHVENLTDAPTPPARYLDSFAGAKVPRAPNFNTPDDDLQKLKPSWLSSLPLLNQTQIDEIDYLHRRRLETLRGVDDIVEDVVKALEKSEAIDNTYIIYSTDQGYHLGTHRHGAGKSTPYKEDTNIPLVVRGPGIKKGEISHIPSTVTDFAPTFLDIASLKRKAWPSFLDGTSMLPSWKNPTSKKLAKSKEAINVEYWGNGYTEIPTWTGGDYGEYFPGLYLKNDYKSMRIVSEKYAWLYSRWCTNDTELYNTKEDPSELVNLANSTETYIVRVKTRLNALLLVTKSCAESTCRDPWKVLQPPNKVRKGKNIRSLEDALNPDYDGFYASFPLVTIEECLGYQFVENEFPFYPQEAEKGLGLAHRRPTDNYKAPEPAPKVKLSGNTAPAGGWEQRHSTLERLLKDARELTDDELEGSADRPSPGEH